MLSMQWGNNFCLLLRTGMPKAQKTKQAEEVVTELEEV